MVGCYEGYYENHPPAGHENITPCIDAMAERGVRFRNAWTSPMCSPTRAQLMTGKQPLRNGIGAIVSGGGSTIPEFGIPGLAPFHDCIPGVLRRSLWTPYYTQLLGKWHRAPFPLAQTGPAHVLGTVGNPWFNSAGGSNHNVYDQNNWEKLIASSDRHPLGMETTPPIGGFSLVRVTEYTAVNTARDAVRFIQTRGDYPETRDRPYLLYVSFNLAHRPIEAPDSVPEECFCRYGTGEINGTTRTVFSGDIPNDTRSLVTLLDNEVGKILCAVEADPTMPDYPTTVVFLGDNGTQSMAVLPPFDSSHAKSTLYEGGINVPMIVTSPIIPRALLGRTTDALVCATDFLATFAELGGTSLPEDTYNVRDSISFLSVLKGESDGEREYNYAGRFGKNFTPDRYGNAPPNLLPPGCKHSQTIRDIDGFKLIRRRWREMGHLRESNELYYLPRDPHEQNDLTDLLSSDRIIAERFNELNRVLGSRYPSLIN